MATLEFNFQTQTILVKSPDTSVTIQELITKIRDEEENIRGINYPQIANAGGKDALSGVEQVGITLTLINEWRLQFEDRLGPSYVSCFVSGGNLVAVNSFTNNPIKPSAFTQVQIRQSQAPTLLAGGGGLTTEEHDWLEFIFDINGGRWKIVSNQMIFYTADGLTIVATFDLKDLAGLPTMGDVFERTRVP